MVELITQCFRKPEKVDAADAQAAGGDLETAGYGIKGGRGASLTAVSEPSIVTTGSGTTVTTHG